MKRGAIQGAAREDGESESEEENQPDPNLLKKIVAYALNGDAYPISRPSDLPPI